MKKILSFISMKMLAIFVIVSLPITFIILLVLPSSNYIYASGSTTLLPMMQLVSEDYKDKTNGNLIVAGGGSAYGITLLNNNLTDIGDSSRYAETQNINGNNEEYNASWWKSISTAPVGLDVILFACNLGDNAPKNFTLTIKDLSDIYSNKISNWNQIKGGPNLLIKQINREDGSGTKDAFYNGLKKYNHPTSTAASLPNGQVANSNGLVITDLIHQQGTIGYFSLGYLEALKEGNTSDIVFPEIKDDTNTDINNQQQFQNSSDSTVFLANLANSLYNNKNFYFWHPMNLMFSVTEREAPKVKKFLEYIYSPESQAKMLDWGYLPVYYNWDGTGLSYPVVTNTSITLVKDQITFQNFIETPDYQKGIQSTSQPRINDPWWIHWLSGTTFDKVLNHE